MKIIDNLFRRKEPKEPWPLRFDSYSFGVHCCNTLKCSVIFDRYQHSIYLDRPSGEPRPPKNWSASFGSTEAFETHGFPSPVDIKWTALDGIERETEIDLETVFPGHEILHNAKQADLEPWWAMGGFFGKGHHAEIFLEVNDRTINFHMKSMVRTKNLRNAPDEPESHEILNDLLLAWTKTF
ncbi:hypothetical protein EBB59_11505 [Lysobacter pythonis]|uniref:Uncharacterized protein n=1 Tax=Solilutibacter pythonis TaxID=2483112 RepID=A0A3M2HFU1_9GAMM|nr:hypothetical protein [Lysobacter pythonis]RMH88596.1 hypothetical protein EBB59_11505 [Lysobacter pythonis]